MRSRSSTCGTGATRPTPTWETGRRCAGPSVFSTRCSGTTASARSTGARPAPYSSGLGRFLLFALLFFALGGRFARFRAVEQAHERERRVVALAKAALEDAQG